ncbi:MAG: abortive infection family protein [Phycisphaerales bacterium]
MNGRDLISKKTRTEFREFLVGSTLREIENEFSSVGLEPDRSFAPQIGGQRREFVEQYYHAISFADPAQVEKVLRVYEAILANTESHLANPGAYVDAAALKREFDKLVACLRRDGYEYADGRLRSKSGQPMLRHLSTTAVRLDAEYLTAQIDRLTAAVEQDPDLAIGQAKELVETCCKTILAAAGETGSDRLDLIPLVKQTMAHLKLLPDDIPETAKGAKTIKAVLGNLAMISQGMAELRNLYGTGHGKHASHKRLPVRHARLAVGAATTLVTFLFDTHESRPSASKQDGASAS